MINGKQIKPNSVLADIKTIILYILVYIMIVVSDQEIFFAW